MIFDEILELTTYLPTSLVRRLLKQVLSSANFSIPIPNAIMSLSTDFLKIPLKFYTHIYQKS
jgi:hypothetical protein